MQQKVTPAMIVIGVVVLAAVVFGIYRMSFAPKPHNISKENMPAYMKGETPSYGKGGPAGGPPSGNPNMPR